VPYPLQERHLVWKSAHRRRCSSSPAAGARDREFHWCAERWLCRRRRELCSQDPVQEFCKYLILNLYFIWLLLYNKGKQMTLINRTKTLFHTISIEVLFIETRLQIIIAEPKLGEIWIPTWYRGWQDGTEGCK
jgi:hypothetical protein